MVQFSHHFFLPPNLSAPFTSTTFKIGRTFAKDGIDFQNMLFCHHFSKHLVNTEEASVMCSDLENYQNYQIDLHCDPTVLSNFVLKYEMQRKMEEYFSAPLTKCNKKLILRLIIICLCMYVPLCNMYVNFHIHLCLYTDVCISRMTLYHNTITLITEGLWVDNQVISMSCYACEIESVNLDLTILIQVPNTRM